MRLPSSNVLLSFGSLFGRFIISPDSSESNVFNLSVLTPGENSPIELGKYCSINDAIFAVAQQETGYLPWDALSLEDVPYRVHDITCWDFEEFFGTTESLKKTHFGT